MSAATQEQFDLVQKYTDVLVSKGQYESDIDVIEMYESGELIDAPQELVEKYMKDLSSTVIVMLDPLLSIAGMEVAIPFIVRTLGMLLGMTAGIFYHLGTLDESRVVKEKKRTVISAINSIDCSEWDKDEDN